MFCSLSGAAVEPRHITVVVLQVFFPDGVCRLGVVLLAEISLSSFEAHFL